VPLDAQHAYILICLKNGYMYSAMYNAHRSNDHATISIQPALLVDIAALDSAESVVPIITVILDAEAVA
jgi:hypothetical protein